MQVHVVGHDVFGGLQRGGGVVEPAGIECQPNLRRRELDVCGNDLCWQRVQPGPHGLQVSRVELPPPCLGHQLTGELGVARLDRVADGLREVALLGIPTRGQPMQRRWLSRCHPGELVTQDASEQVVVSKPRMLVVERCQEQIGAVDLVQDARAVHPASERVGQRGADPVEHRRAEQEFPDVLGLTGEHLLAQVVDHVPVSARETFDELRAVCTVRQPQRRQLQTRCPPLRTDDEPLDVLR